MWAVIFEVALKVVGFLIDKQKISKEAADNFFAFVKKAGDDMGSVKLKEYGDTQVEWLKNNPWPQTAKSEA